MTAAVLPAAETLEPTRRALREARTLPAQFCLSARVFDLEQTELFAKMWLCVARDEDLAEPGDFVTREIANERILILRDSERRVRAFFNVCRHRGSRLIEAERGSGLKRISCPYHAWTYGLDGRLANAPRAGSELRREDFPLLGVPLEIWNGFIFINLDREAAPLARYFADLPDFSRFQLAELRRAHEIVYDVAANWKLVCENYSECYHCALAHPQLNRISDTRSGGQLLSGACFNGGPMRLNEGFTTMSMSGHSAHPTIPGLSDEDRRTLHYYVVYPNLLLSLHPDYVLVHTLRPVAPDRTCVTCEWFFTQAAIAMPGFNPDDAVEFWDVTNRQDWALCERVQRGIASRGYVPGAYQPSEHCVHAFDQWYAESIAPRLADAPG